MSSDSTVPTEEANAVVITEDNARIQYESQLRPIIRPIKDAPDVFQQRIEQVGSETLFAAMVSLGVSVRTDYKLLLKLALNDDDTLIRQFETLFDRMFQEDQEYALSIPVQHFLPLYVVVREFYAQNAGKLLHGDKKVTPPNQLFELRYEEGASATDDAAADKTETSAKQKLQPAHQALGDVMEECMNTPGTFFSYLEHAMDAMRAVIVASMDIPVRDVLCATTSAKTSMVNCIAATVHTLCNPDTFGHIVTLLVARDLNEDIAELGFDLWYSRVCESKLVKLVDFVNEAVGRRVQHAMRFNGLTPAVAQMHEYLHERNSLQCAEDCFQTVQDVKVRDDDPGHTIRAIFERIRRVADTISQDDAVPPVEKISHDMVYCISAHLYYLRSVLFSRSDVQQQNEEPRDYAARISTFMSKCAAFLHTLTGAKHVVASVRHALHERGIQFWINMLGGSPQLLVDHAMRCAGVQSEKQLPDSFQKLSALFTAPTDDATGITSNASTHVKLMREIQTQLAALNAVAVKAKKGEGDAAPLYRRIDRLRQLLPKAEDPLLDVYCGVYVLYVARLSAMQCVDDNLERWNKTAAAVSAAIEDNTLNAAQLQNSANRIGPHTPGCFVPKHHNVSSRLVKTLYAFLGNNSIALNRLLMNKSWDVELLSLGCFYNSDVVEAFPISAHESLATCEVITRKALETQHYSAMYHHMIEMEWIAPLLFDDTQCIKFLQYSKKDKMSEMLWTRFMSLFASGNKHQLKELCTSSLATYKRYAPIEPTVELNVDSKPTMLKISKPVD